MTRHETHITENHAELLKTIERSRLAFLCWLVLAAIVEVGSLIAFILLADWHDRLHQLLAVMSLLIYGTLCLALMSLFSYVRLWVLKVIKAIEVLADTDGNG